MKMNEKMHMKEGHYQSTSKMPFKWRFDCKQIVAQDCMLAGCMYKHGKVANKTSVGFIRHGLFLKAILWLLCMGYF